MCQQKITLEKDFSVLDLDAMSLCQQLPFTVTWESLQGKYVIQRAATFLLQNSIKKLDHHHHKTIIITITAEDAKGVFISLLTEEGIQCKFKILLTS